LFSLFEDGCRRLTRCEEHIHGEEREPDHTDRITPFRPVVSAFHGESYPAGLFPSERRKHHSKIARYRYCRGILTYFQAFPIELSELYWLVLALVGREQTDR